MLTIFLLVLAAVLFLFAGLNVAHPRLNLQALGLLSLTVALILHIYPSLK